MTAPTRALAVVCAAVAACYVNGVWGVFHFDDYNVIVVEPSVHSLQAWLADLGHGIRPLLKLTYTLNWIVDAGAPGFHLFNLGVHVVNTVLVAALARTLAQRMGEPAARHADVCAIATAVLFGLHPAQTEAVTYVSGRSISLMALFYLGGLVAWVEGERSGCRLLRVGLPPLLFACALLTKESAVTFPLALLLCAAVRRDRPVAWPQLLRVLAPCLALLALAGALLALHPIYGQRLAPDWNPAAMQQNFLTQIDGVFYLVRRLVWIYPLNIDPDLVVVTAWTPALAAKLAVLVALPALAAWGLRHRPWVGFGVLWFFLQLAPTNTLVPRQDIANDRQLYLAGVGIFFATGMEFALAAGRPWMRAAATAVVIALAAFTVARNRDYASEIRLWEQTAGGSPHKARVFNNLGYAYHAAGCVPQAEHAYRQALALDPGFELARENLRNLRLGFAAEAVGPDPHECAPAR